MKEKILWVVAVIALVLGGAALLKAPHSVKEVKSGQFGAAGNLLAENYIPYVLYNQGYNSAKDFAISGSSAFSGTSAFSGAFSSSATSTFSGLVVHDSGVTNSLRNSTTTTVAAYTLVENDLAPGGICYSAFSFTKTVGASGGGNLSTTTLTTAASSTFANIVPNAGDWCDMVVESATSSASQLGMIWAFGTGWDPETSSTTPTGLTINGGSRANFRIYRRADTDIGVNITIFKDAD